MPVKEKPAEKEPSWIRILRWSLAGGFTLLFLVLVLCQSNSGFLSSLPGRCLTNTFAFLAVGSFLFVRKRLPHPLIGAMAILFAFGFSYLTLLVSRKVYSCVMLSAALLTFLLSIALALTGRFRKGKKASYQSLAGNLLLIGLLFFLGPTGLVIATGFRSPFPFGIPFLVAAVLGTIPGVYLAIKKGKGKVPVWLRSIGYGACGCLFAGIAAWGLLTTLDVAYDFSAPEYKTCYVVEKDVERYRAGRGPTVYELTFLDGEETFSIGVPYDVYKAAEEGDPILVASFGGFLGEGYYLYPGYL